MRSPRALTVPAVIGLALVLTACGGGPGPQPGIPPLRPLPRKPVVSRRATCRPRC
jgi:hypothetical protein